MEGDYAAQAALDIGYRILDCPSLVRSIGQMLQNPDRPDLLPLLHLRSPMQGLHLIPRPLILLRGAVDNLKGIKRH
jgi:hypothetical protein